MILSLTLMPVLASYALKKGRGDSENRMVRWLKRALQLAPRLGSPEAGAGPGARRAHGGQRRLPRHASRLGVRPTAREQAIVINTVRIAGVSLDESVRYGTHIERFLLERFPDEIEHVWTRTGTAEVATDPMGLEVSDVFITLRPRNAWTRGDTQDELVAQMSAEMEGLPGMRAIFTQPIEMRVNEMLAGIRADVGIKLFGDDFELLVRGPTRSRAPSSGSPGRRTSRSSSSPGRRCSRSTSTGRRRGATGSPSARSSRPSTRSARAGRRGHRGATPLRSGTSLGEDARSSQARIGQVLIRTSGGAQVPLSAVADIDLAEGPSTIQREWARRRVSIQANVRGRDVGSFVADVRRVLREDIELPEGYYTALGGQFENLERAQRRLLIVVPIALLLVFSLLYLTYGRAADALRVFTGVPFGAVGGVAALWLRDMPFSISAGVGFIALSGVAVLGDMVLVSPRHAAPPRRASRRSTRSARRPRPDCGPC
jgi:cobalt-zinc-cadmium resistance protein CzcA